MPGRIFHLKRRLSAEEEALVGPAIDVRDTAEAEKRIQRVLKYAPGLANFVSANV